MSYLRELLNYKISRIKLVISSKIFSKKLQNEIISRTLAERVRLTTASLEILKIRRERDFHDEIYYAAFNKLEYVLEEIKKYINEISKIHPRKYAKAINFKLKVLTEKYETAMKDLQFTLAIANEERRRYENQALTQDLNEFDKYFRMVDGKIDIISEHIMHGVTTDIKKLLAEAKTNIKDFIAEEWIRKKIIQEDIKYFEYSEFSNPEKIGEGGFGIVNKAETSDKMQVALKCLIEKKSSEIDEKVIKNFIKELQNLRKVTHHENIISFLGISKGSGYIMVLEYANEGNLRDYLKKEFVSLKWENKIRMALDITCGLKCLHSNEIIHRDLHSKNILVNNGKLLIADFGLSKRLTEDTSNSTGNRTGVIEYIDPQCFKDNNYVRREKSDIYSLGVLFWEISSGRPPFQKIERNVLADYIVNMKNREETIEGTPSEYERLYQKCWDDDPEKRPAINQVYDDIKQISRQYNANGSNKQEDSLAASNNDRFNSSDQSDQYYLTDIVTDK